MNNRNGTGTMDQSQEKIGEKLDERIDSIKLYYCAPFSI